MFIEVRASVAAARWLHHNATRARLHAGAARLGARRPRAELRHDAVLGALVLVASSRAAKRGTHKTAVAGRLNNAAAA